MSQSNENHISDQDHQRISIYQLGRPLKVYRPSPRSLRSAYVLKLFEVIAYTFMAIGFWNLRSLSFIADVCLALALAVAVHRLMTCRDGREAGLIVCETGLMTVTKIHGLEEAQVIYWKNVQMQNSYFIREKCHLDLQVGKYQKKSFEISAADYQDGHELIASIKEQIAEVKKQI